LGGIGTGHFWFSKGGALAQNIERNLIMAGTKGRSGGPRPNSGRPRKVKTVSEATKKAILKAARELAKEHGMSLEKAMLSLCFKDDVQDSVRASVWKSYLESMVAKESKQEIDMNKERISGPTIYKMNDRGEMVITRLGSPTIGLPEIKPDPALKTMQSRKAKNIDE
jgi:hypothetical protein